MVLEDGTVRVFYRSGSSVLCYTDYLWVDGEYVRDESSTSVSTEAVKNSGNGCMLSAVKYPEKINGREMIFVATPATTNSRSDGHVYAFYVNRDGSMELAADYDITPYAAEYYAYSCLTVLTHGEEAGDLALFWEDSWASSPAAATIRYSVLPIREVLAGLREVVRKDVTLTVGETAVFEDTEGYYVGADLSGLDPEVASAEITGTVTKTVLGADQAVSAPESGTRYILVNTRAGKPMTNAASSAAAAAGAGSGLSLAGVKENVPESAVWTIEAAEDGWLVRDTDGRYLTISSNGAAVTDARSVVTIARNGSTWTISQNGAYLNDFGGGGTCAAGWQHSSAPTDAGSQWTIHTVKEIPVEGTSRITFTGVGAGETQVQIGYVRYCITVTDAAAENPFVDVSEGDFFYDSVLWAVEKGITTGVDKTHFAPASACIRAQVVTFLWRAAGEPEPETSVNPFEDVNEGDYFYKAVLWALEKGITTGVDAEHFGPMMPCNRAQVVTFLWRAAGEPDAAAESVFSDVTDPGTFYYNAVRWAVENGITTGMGDGTFGVATDCNRAQIVTFLYRAYNK